MKHCHAVAFTWFDIARHFRKERERTGEKIASERLPRIPPLVAIAIGY